MSCAESHSTSIAAVSGSTSYTYRELSELALTYAGELSNANLRHGDAVVVQMEPGIELLASLIALSMLGGVYVPCNAALPPERLNVIAARVKAAGLIVSGSEDSEPNKRLMAGLTARVPVFYANSKQLRGRARVRAGRGPDRSVIESDLAYVIFTSGSTGDPKGVMMSHRAALAAFRGIERACDVRGSIGSCAPAGFDLSLLDMAAALGRGQTLNLIPRNTQLHPIRFVEHLAEHEITQVHSVPSLWRIVMRFASAELAALRRLRRVVVGGEPLSPSLVASMRAAIPGLEVVNLFGQTETLCCSFYEVPMTLKAGAESIPIGEPYPGVDMVLLDDERHEVTEVGGIGELYLRAASMFSGYWGDPELTDERIVSAPVGGTPQERWFRTGDRLRKQLDGLHFVDRVDRQVQLFGNRVELGEVETQLRSHPGVEAVAVVPVADEEGKWTRHLVAFVQFHGQVSDDAPVGELLTYCRERLPAYMVPAHVVAVDALPLAATGKIDYLTLTSNLSWGERR